MPVEAGVRPSVSQRSAVPPAIALSISPVRVAAVLAVVVTILIAAHFTLMYMKYQLGHDYVVGLVRRFDVLRETNIPTWYSSVALLTCAAVLALIAGAKRRMRDRFAWHWLGLALVFVYLSMDEGAMVHETVQTTVRVGVDPSDPFYGQVGMIFPALLALVVFLAYLRFLAALPRRTAVLFLAAGALLIGGGVGVDHIGDLHAIAHGQENMRYAVLNGIEEALEMFGVVTFLYALLDYLETRVGSVRLNVSSRGAAS